MEHLIVSRKKDYAIVQLSRGKVNAINHALVMEIREMFRELASDAEVRGVIITGQPHYFSAGLDLIEMQRYDLAQIRAFWTDFMAMMTDLVLFPKPTIAAISGYSPAGGAVIAITCDYRMMAAGDKYHIGLNEVALGVPIEENIFDVYSFWLGRKKAYQALLQGKLFSVAEALEIGLLDEVHELESLLAKAEERMMHLLKANDYILRDAKQKMRRALVADVSRDMSASISLRARQWMSPEFQAMLAQIVDRITSKSK